MVDLNDNTEVSPNLKGTETLSCQEGSPIVKFF